MNHIMAEQNPGFKIQIEEINKIYQQLKNPTESAYYLGSSALPIPFNNISVSCDTNGSLYKSLTRIEIDTFQRDEDLKAPVKTLEGKFKVKTIRDNVLILDEEGKPEYEVIPSWLGNMGIFFGNKIISSATTTKNIGTLEDFVKQLNRYKEVIETTVNGIYLESGRKTPDVVMYWRPAMTTEFQAETTGLGGIAQKYPDLMDKIEIEKPNITFTDIGGQKRAKLEIQGLSFALKNPELYRKWGTSPPKGILLYGPPGTGKTLMAKALAREADAKFYHVSVSDITSMWYGKSEKLMAAIFNLAKENGKTIIFFDEMDALAPQRDYSHEATGRIVATLLENLDGIGSSSNVMVVGATNRLEAIEPALTRPGRFDRLVEVPLPDEAGRRQIFDIHMEKAQKIAGRNLFEALDYNALLKQTDQYSGADISEIVRRTLEEKVRQEVSWDGVPTAVTTQEIIEQIKNYERTKEVKNKIGFI